MKRDEIKYKVGDIAYWKDCKLIFRISEINKGHISHTFCLDTERIEYRNLKLEHHPNYIRPATEEEKLWFEYCESFGEYRTKEEAIENMYVREFVEQYLTE